MAGSVDLPTTRTTPPDPIAVQAAIKTATGDPTASLVQSRPGVWRGKKATPWSQAHHDAAQTIVDTTAALTPQQIAQRIVDGWPIEYRALVLALIDETNRLRAALRGLGVAGLPDVTPVQAITAIRNKAGTLS